MSNASPSASPSSSSLFGSTYIVSSAYDFASLPSEPTSQSDSDDDLSLSGSGDEYSDAEEQWKESIQQLELLLTMVIVPFIGKYLGRRCAYWGWAKFMEWKYPIVVVIANKGTLGRTGTIGTAASL